MTIRYIKEINKPTDIDIVIPAAGLGKRMKSYGAKPLIKIRGNTSIIDNQIRILKKFLPNSNIIIVCGFDADNLMNKTDENIVKIENENYVGTNVARSIGMGLRATKRDVLIVYGDLIFNEKCIEEMNFNKSSLLAGKGIMSEGEVGCTFNKKGQLEHMMYDLEYRWGQMVFLKGNELKIFKKICYDRDNQNMFGFEAINKTMSQGGVFHYSGHDKARVIDIDSSKDLERVSEVI